MLHSAFAVEVSFCAYLRAFSRILGSFTKFAFRIRIEPQAPVSAALSILAIISKLSESKIVSPITSSSSSMCSAKLLAVVNVLDPARAIRLLITISYSEACGSPDLRNGLLYGNLSRYEASSIFSSFTINWVFPEIMIARKKAVGWLYSVSLSARFRVVIACARMGLIRAKVTECISSSTFAFAQIAENMMG